jgi:hypothetical protein
MKIIVPFDEKEFFSQEEIACMSILQLDAAAVMDQALLHWTKYVYDDVEVAYEQTIDDAYEYIQQAITDPSARYRAELILSDQADLLARIVRSMAFYLHRFVLDMPDDLNRIRWQPDSEDDGYAFMKVHSINTLGKFAILTSDATYTILRKL